LDTGTTILRLLLAVLCGGLLGIERERKKRPAGLRTYILVCLGSTLVMMTNEFITDKYDMVDPTRMGAQVISGIGFLGAGTIIVTTRNHVRGLTTAAGLWAAACMGLAIGSGFYLGAAIGCVLVLIAMSSLHYFDDRVMAKAKIVNLYIEFRQSSSLSSFMQRLKDLEIKVVDMEVSKVRTVNESSVAVLLTIRMPKPRNHTEVISTVSALEGVCYVEEV